MKDKVPSTTAGCRHMAKEREFLALRRILEQDAHKIYDELEAIFQQVIGSNPWKEAHKKYNELDVIIQKIKETKAKIEEQRQKQQVVNTRQLEEPW